MEAWWLVDPRVALLQDHPPVMISMAGKCAQNIFADLWKFGELIDRRFHHVCLAHSVIFTARALVFSTVRLPKFYRAPDTLRCVSTRCVDAKQRANCAPSPHTVGARSVPTRAALHRRAGIEPRRHHRLGAHRRSPLELLVQPYLHTRIPWPRITTNTPNTPAPTCLPPHPDPRRIAAAAPRSSRRRRHGSHWQLNANLPVPHSVCSHLPLGVNDGSPHLLPACTRLPRRQPRCLRGRRGR